ncbi:MAG: hypothetical protein VYE68_05975 [Acidobacteriota bacterium]|nr:hypothetical protein [Acidobacteriota bacterium]
MSRDDNELDRSLENNQITTAKVDRRSFLARAAGAGTLAFGAMITAACGDSCDTDAGDSADSDPNDPIDADLGDTCDTDD